MDYIKRLFLLFLLFNVVLFSHVVAQKIMVSIPQASSRQYVFTLNKGIDADTIQQGVFNIAGGAEIIIPSQYSDYVGMGTLYIQDENVVNLVIDHENFTLERGADRKNRFKNSPENEYLYALINKEEVPPADTSLYATFFVDLLGFARGLDAAVSQGADLRTRVDLRLYATDKLDMERLYTSGVWHLVIDRLARLSSDQETMGNDFVQILKRIKSQEVFEHLADNLITMMNQYGWDEAFDIVVPYIADSHRIEVPQGKIYDAFRMTKIRRGDPVPSLVGLDTPLGLDNANTLIMFYESDCHNCILQLQELKNNYARLKNSNVRVVTISADYNKNVYEKEAATFPWSDKLCDYKGFGGTNFSNYGVLGTPTFYLLDKDLRLVKRFALFSDVNL